MPTPQEVSDRQIDSPLFVCTVCGEPVIIFGGNYFRTCEHSDSMIAVTYDGLKAVSDGV